MSSIEQEFQELGFKTPDAITDGHITVLLPQNDREGYTVNIPLFLLSEKEKKFAAWDGLTLYGITKENALSICKRYNKIERGKL